MSFLVASSTRSSNSSRPPPREDPGRPGAAIPPGSSGARPAAAGDGRRAACQPAGFVDIIASYRLGGTPVAVLIASGLIGGELAAGVGLSSDAARRRRAAAIALGVTVAWTAVGVQAFVRGLALENCGCFGVYAAQPLRWWVLVEDVEFVGLAVWVRRWSRFGPTFRSRGRVRSDDDIEDHRPALELEHGRPT